ncbi:bifunctional serine/threonine-protein kinase/ABC transporter substrate-binding protein [Streptomyces sp. MAR4 CNX-425]|uniref:bifunctional serine/threonine-protein kinase/ABC transporter substrate-binding protein n=1 Tax=Streptomyces sp. MAR4 CNX-425 TaxID=3406343 RepID=UPI003B5078A7
MREDLRPSDPARIGGYRLLGRLGAGGMGVVYLGRADDTGALAAVKVIRADLAEDEAYRERFRREVRSARSVDSRWAAAVTGAETEGARPWLATAFVPGPTLAEAVARCGPLPPRAVRVLGKMLARALAVVHDAGLAHRDVKPGNVLLALDGPRLIDFGVARGAADTTITSGDVVVGTPGFLSPEQARGADIGGPAGDVFSLGCLLAYAATGRPPFGTGAADAVLYRTVHDEPDLAGPGPATDTELRELLTACLAKDPAARPAARELDERLVEDTPADPADWLPESVVGLIAERSAALLAPIDIEATRVDGAAAAGPGRRRVLAFASGGAVLAAGGGFGLWAALADDSGSPPPAKRRHDALIAVQGDLSGVRRDVGRAQVRGVRLAVEEFNARKDKPFTLGVTEADDGGDRARAERVAEGLVRNDRVLAVVGPTGDVTTAAVLGTYGEARLPLLTVSSASLTYSIDEGRSLFVLCPSYAVLAEPVVARLVGRGVTRLGVLLDRAGASAAYQQGFLANRMAAASIGTHPRVVPAGTEELGPVVADIVDAYGADGFYYAGDGAGGGRTARAVAATGFTGPRVAFHTSMTPDFLAEAGDGADGWEFIAPFTAVGAAGTEEFAAAHEKRFGEPPAYWAAEAYDAATLVGDALTRLAKRGKPPPRADLLKRLAASRHEGISRTYAFTKEREVEGADAHRYVVRDGRFRYAGPVPRGT